jgi:hypothetical protein
MAKRIEPTFSFVMAEKSWRLREVLDDVIAERQRQDAKWGGASHDDEHSARDWSGFRLIREVEALASAGVLADESIGDWTSWEGEAEYKKALVEIAALAIAQLESFERQRQCR